MDLMGTPLVTDPFNLTPEVGAILVTPAGGTSKFMQYGKLPKRDFKIKRTNPEANINWIYLLPQKNDILEMNTLFATEFKNIFQNGWHFSVFSDYWYWCLCFYAASGKERSRGKSQC